MAHTPGPWAAYPPEFTDGKCWTVQTDSGMTVRVCGGDTPENGGNARLIAAAPELLAALKSLFEDWVTLVGEDLKEQSDDVAMLWKCCEGAISKAEGRAE